MTKPNNLRDQFRQFYAFPLPEEPQLQSLEGPLEALYFSIGGYGCNEELYLIARPGITSWFGDAYAPEAPVDVAHELQVSQEQWEEIERFVTGEIIPEWVSTYDTDVCDGTQWGLVLTSGKTAIRFYGSNAYPIDFKRFFNLLDAIEGKPEASDFNRSGYTTPFGPNRPLLEIINTLQGNPVSLDNLKVLLGMANKFPTARPPQHQTLKERLQLVYFAIGGYGSEEKLYLITKPRISSWHGKALAPAAAPVDGKQVSTSDNQWKTLRDFIESVVLPEWLSVNENNSLDGTQWSLMLFSRTERVSYYGSNVYPKGFDNLLTLLKGITAPES